MPDGLSTYDKYYYLAEVICEKNDYDDRPKNCYTAFGALIGGRSVCEGYSRAFYLLCKEAGLWCDYRSGNGHIWNMVMIDGNLYNVDVTWCDGKEAASYRWYDNFVKSDEHSPITDTVDRRQTEHGRRRSVSVRGMKKSKINRRTA
jgi:hypothetical protein